MRDQIIKGIEYSWSHGLTQAEIRVPELERMYSEKGWEVAAVSRQPKYPYKYDVLFKRPRVLEAVSIEFDGAL